MELIKRKVISSLPKRVKIKAIGFNSNEVMTICYINEKGEEYLLNFKGDEFNKIRKFINRIDYDK